MFIWNFAGTNSAFLRWSKTPKKAEGFWFGVYFSHFCLSVFHVTLFLENHSIFFHEILYSCSWYNIGGQYTQTMVPVSLGPFFGYFGGLFWHMYLFFFISVQYFVMKFCTGVLDITLIITNTFFDIMFPSSGGHFRVFWGLFWHITSTFWEPFNMFSWNFVQTFFVFLLRVTALFFSISWPSWGALG